jgi:hypothetical protein
VSTSEATAGSRTSTMRPSSSSYKRKIFLFNVLKKMVYECNLTFRILLNIRCQIMENETRYCWKSQQMHTMWRWKDLTDLKDLLVKIKPVKNQGPCKFFFTTSSLLNIHQKTFKAPLPRLSTTVHQRKGSYCAAVGVKPI